MAKLRVVLEAGKQKVFASALDWPGWSRSGRSEEQALATLADYAPRYAVVAKQAGQSFPATVADAIDVVERLTGGASTDFGVPGRPAKAEQVRLTAAPARRQAALVAAAWAVLDEVAVSAPEVLRKGPRGGGRDRTKMLNHLLDAESGYARRIGIRLRPPAVDDLAAIEELREAMLAVIGAPSDGDPVVEKGWTTAYAARRIAWHTLDHAWEMQDRAE